ncbi:BCCT family transporter, partial [Pseudoalteromonas issachenkonii]
DSTDYQVGQDNDSKWRMHIHSNVFSVSIGLSLLIIITLLALSTSEAKDAINTIKNAALTYFDYVFMWGANIL